MAEAKETTVEAKGTFEERHGYNWDFVLVFPVRQPNEIIRGEAVKWPLLTMVRKMRKCGLETASYVSACRRHVYTLIRASPARLLLEAEERQYKMLLVLSTMLQHYRILACPSSFVS
jgi:hypothetical protein